MIIYIIRTAWCPYHAVVFKFIFLDMIALFHL